MKTTIARVSTTSSATRPAPDRSASTAAARHDAELVRRFNAGDEAAFLEIMSRYREKLFLIINSFLRNHADAEEITQDTFVRAYQGLARFRGDSSLATWLHSIALNLARNRYWFYYRRRRHATISLDSPLGESSTATLAELVAADSPDPARTAVADEFHGLIAACMERLAPPHREILTLRNILHRSYGDIARTQGITVGTVKSRIARARRNVRALLSEMCPEFACDTGLGEWFEPSRASGRLAVA